MRRYILATINIVSALAAIILVIMLKVNLIHNNVFDVLRTNDYVSSLDFKEKTQRNMNNVFEYIRLSKVFEKDNKINESSNIAYSLEPFEDKNSDTTEESIKNATMSETDNALSLTVQNEWKMGYIMKRAQDFGIYLDENYNVQVNSTKVSSILSNDSYTYYNKKYVSTFAPAPVFNQQQTEMDFISEVYTQLGNYYKLKKYFENTNFKYIVRYYNDAQNIEYSNNELTLEQMRKSDAFFYVTTVGNMMESNINELNTRNVFSLLISNNSLAQSNSYFCMMVDIDFPVNDDYRSAYVDIDAFRNRISRLLTGLVISIGIFIISLIFIFISCLYKSKNRNINKKNYSVISFEGMFIILTLIAALFIYFSCELFKGDLFIDNDITQYYSYVFVVIIYACVLVYILFIIYQFENSYLDSKEYKRSIVGSIMYGMRKLFSNLPLRVIFSTLIIPFAILIAMVIGFVYHYIRYNSLLSLIVSIVLFILTILLFMYFSILNRAYSQSIVSESKSSQMRVDLITNISHDIKTPITSIISYSDILKKALMSDNFDKASILNYTDVILQKSGQLNILLEDLLLASKASSNSMEFNFQDINVNGFVAQIVDNFSVQLLEKGLEIIAPPLNENVVISADGDQLFRVFQNLFSNIYKYALENTRVYVKTISNMTNVVIEVSNISKDKLEGNPDVLTERFSKADYSRNSEGFGLGLSIVKDLIKDMGGTFDIRFEGDTFVAVITFLKKK